MKEIIDFDIANIASDILNAACKYYKYETIKYIFIGKNQS